MAGIVCMKWTRVAAYQTNCWVMCHGTQRRHQFPANMHSSSTTSAQRKPGVFAFSLKGLSDRVQQLHKNVEDFMDLYIYPLERELMDHSASEAKWTVHPIIEELKAKARQQGLWNLFVSQDIDPDGKYGPGLTQSEYAHFMELMGRIPYAAEIFNCSAPDTGNMELLIRFGNCEQKKQWLEPLLDGTIRSAFSMTEPKVTSTDAGNLKSEINREGDEYIINGHKWFTSGTFHPNCKICIFMGRTDMGADREHGHSMVLVPMDTPGIKKIRHLSLFGYEDAPFGHAEIVFKNVRVPASNMILGEGRGIEIARGRMGTQRVRHCMRLIGVAERALDLMKTRVANRVAFGKPLISQGTIQADIAQSRMDIEQARLISLKAAHLVDTVDYKSAAKDLAIMMKVVPRVTSEVVDRAIQAHGGAGLSQDFPLAYFYAATRVSRLGDISGMIAKLEMRSLSKKGT